MLRKVPTYSLWERLANYINRLQGSKGSKGQTDGQVDEAIHLAPTLPTTTVPSSSMDSSFKINLYGSSILVPACVDRGKCKYSLEADARLSFEVC